MLKRLILFIFIAVSAFAQNASPVPVPKIQFFDNNGKPLSLGYVYTYAAGTTTPLPTYTDSTAGTPNTNPVLLDSGGFANIWLLGSECYKLVVQNSSQVQVSSTDNICAPVNGGSLNVALSSPPPIGNVAANAVWTKPFYVTAGAGGDTNYRSFTLSMANNGQLTGNFLNSSGANPDVFTAYTFQPWFQVGPEGSSGGIGAGLWQNQIPFWPWSLEGGTPIHGTLANYPQPDPQTGVCFITHTGAGGAGAPTYYMRWLDAQSHYSNAVACAGDGTGYPTPDSTHINIVNYYQDQPSIGSGHFGGAYSDALIARGNALTGVLNLSGVGVISNLSPCENKYPSTPCTYSDNGSASVTTLSALAGLQYDGLGLNNTADAFIQGRANVGRGLEPSGGTIQQGRFVTKLTNTPPAPNVNPNATGSSTISYALVVHDLGLGYTLPGTDTTITNSASTANNTIGWNIGFGCRSVDVVRHNSTYYSMPNSTGLPCYGNNSVGGFTCCANATYTDTGGTYTAYPTSRDTSADMEVVGALTVDVAASSPLVVATNNTSTPLVFACAISGGACDTTKGYLEALGGDSTHTGFLAWYDHTNTRQWHLGNDTTANLTLTPDNSGTFIVAGNFQVTGSCTGCGGGGGSLPTSTIYNGLAYSSSSAVEGVSPLVYSAELFGIVADNATDQTANINAAATTLEGLGVPTKLKLPLGITLVSSATLPLILKNTILVGSGTNGWNAGTLSAPTSYLHLTNTPSSGPQIQCTTAGFCGAEHLVIVNDSNSDVMGPLYTCGIPWLDDVMWVGKTAAGPKTNACDDSGPCPVNDGIQYGTAGQTGESCGTVSSSFGGYGTSYQHNLYFQNMRLLMAFNENANGMTITGVRTDFTDANPSGYAIQMGESSGSAYSVYENNIQGNFEQAPYQATNGGSYDHCNYGEIFGLTAYATNNIIKYGDSDVGNCVHSTIITTANSSHNDITVMDGDVSGVPVDDVHGAGSANNTVHDMVSRTETVQTIQTGAIGTSSLPLNTIIYGIYVVSGLPGSPVEGTVLWIGDSTNGSCTSGSGTISTFGMVECQYNGSAWVPVGNNSSPTLNAPVLGTATATSMLASGISDGEMPITKTTGSSASLGGTYKSGYTFNQEATANTAVTYTLPGGTSAGGQKYCIANSNNGTAATTGQLKLQTASPSTQVIIFTDGTITTSTGYLLSDSSGSAAGDEICVASIDSTHWQVVGTPRGTWTAH